MSRAPRARDGAAEARAPAAGASPSGSGPARDAVGGPRPRVVLVLGTLVMGGAEAQLASVLEADPGALQRFDVRILAVTSHASPHILARLQALGVGITTIDREALGFVPFLRSLVRHLRRERPDLVHTFLTGSTGTWGRIAARLAGVPFVLHSDLSLAPTRTVTRVQRALRPLVDRLTDRFLPNAAAIVERLQRQGVPAAKIRLVRNGVDVARFDPARVASPRAGWGIPEDAVVAGFLGMLRRVKRPELALEAVLALPEAERPDYLLVAGDGELMPELRQRVEADPWLRRRCRLLGVVADTPAFLKGLDFLLLTSDTEGLPNAVLEAMAMARPSVATRVSDVPFLIGNDGLLAEPGDVAGLAEAVRRMSALAPAERAAMGARLRRRAEREFALDKAAADFWAVHRELLDAAPRRPELALFLPSLLGGGAERVMLDLAGAFAAEGVAVELVVASATGAYRDAVPAAVPVVDLGRTRVATSAWPLLRYLWRRRPRALLSTLEHANVLALLLRPLAPGLRVVVREANTPSRDLAGRAPGERLLLALMRRTYPRADAVVAVSEGVADDLTRALRVPRTRLRVLCNPVLTPRLWAGARAPAEHPWFAPGEPPVVLGAGRLAPQKRFDTLLRAFARARVRAPCRLMILGEGEERAALEALAAELGVADAVLLPGFVANPFPAMARAGAFVLSSAWEGLPNVLIQAVALGTPAVATDCPSGPREILEGGALGALVPVGDASAMADAIVAALEGGRRRPPERWLERYDAAAVARAYLEVLEVAR